MPRPTPMLPLALALLAQSPADPPPEVQARVPGSYVAVSLRLADYADDVALARQAARELGDKALLFGHFGAGATVSITAEPEGEEHHPSAWWRARIAGEGGERFEVGDVACLEGGLEQGGLRLCDFHAFPVAAGYCFDVHVSALGEGGEPALDRAAFTAIVESFRVAFLRRGWREDYPERVLDVMHAAAVRMPGGVGWLEQEERRDPRDYAPPFVRGELLKVLRAPNDEIVAAYARALPRFEALEAPTVRQIFAWAVAEDGLGLGLANSGRMEPAIAHYRRGYELAAGIRHRVRASLAYNLACALALTGAQEEALVFLRRAVEVDARYRGVARGDSDLESLRAAAAFQELVAGGDDD